VLVGAAVLLGACSAGDEPRFTGQTLPPEDRQTTTTAVRRTTTTDGQVPTERANGGTLPTDDPNDMTADEHRQAACDEIAEIRRSIMSGDLRIHGDQLDYIISHTGAGDDVALDDAANDFTHGIADGDGPRVDDAVVRLEGLCDL
jgi:hypothetical protein